jgi:hypothetical protein
VRRVVFEAQSHKDNGDVALGWRPAEVGTIAGMSDADGKPLDQRLEEIGAQLAWVRDYL